MDLTWERPGDEQLTWWLDDHQTPGPVGPLSQSVYSYMFQTYTKVQRVHWGRAQAPTMRIMFVYGRFYVYFRPGSPMSEEGKATARQTPVRWEREWLPEIKANLNRLNAVDLPSLTDDQLSATLQDGLKTLGRHWKIHHSLAFTAVDQLVGWYKERFPGAPASEPYKLLQGFSNASMESDRALWSLTALVTPAVAQQLRAGAPASDLPQPFRGALATFLERYGGRPAGYCDLGLPTWQEDPSPVYDLLLRYAAEAVPEPGAVLAQLADEREAFTTAVRSALTPDEQVRFDALLPLARGANQLREDHALWIEVRTTAALRRICAEYGRRMTAAGILATAADVAFLTAPELLRYGFGIAQPHLREAIAQRRAEHEANLSWTPAEWVGAAPEAEEPEPAPAGATGLKGVGASPGVARGPARVVHSLEEGRLLRRGEILICRDSDPDWTMLFPLAAAVVTDRGGALSHAAVVAREYGLPAVCGTGNATQAIQDGQLIEVDGTAGTVTIVR